MKLQTFVLLFLVVDQGACFLILPRSRSHISNNAFASLSTASTALFMSSSQNEEEKVVAPSSSTSFDEAGRSIIDEEDQKRMDAMGDFDSNPEYTTDNIERMRAAIRERASDLGVEKSVADQQYFAEVAAKARANVGNKNPSSMLDLSQISTGDERKPGGSQWDEDLPSMLYDPTDDLTEEERNEVDKVGQLSLWQQAMVEVGEASWPTPLAAVKKLGVMMAIVVFSGVLIVGWDNTLRTIYTEAGLIPRQEDIPGQLQEGLELPEGFTNNMNEEDLAKLTEELNQAGKAVPVGSATPIEDL